MHSATVQKNAGLKAEMLETLNFAIDEIPSLSEVAPKVTQLTTIAKMLFTIDHPRAGRLIEQAENKFAPYKKYSSRDYLWYDSTKEAIETTKREWETAKK